MASPTLDFLVENNLVMHDHNAADLGAILDPRYLKLDQTTPQTIANGQPIFDTLTASQLVATNANKNLQTLAVATYPTLTQLSYVKGVTSAIQTQLNGKLATGLALLLAGGTMTGGITNSTSVSPLTTLAESWIGPSSTAGIYFKGGNVGTGTTDPTAKLHIVGSFVAEKNGSNPFGFYSYDNVGSLYPYLDFKRARGTIASPASVLTGDILGGINFYGKLNGGYGFGGALLGANAYGDGSFMTPYLEMIVGSTITQYWYESGIYMAVPLITQSDLTISGMTAGSVLFAGTGGLLSQSNANLFWDNTNKRLGIGTTSPTNILSLGGNAVRKFWMERHTTADTAGNTLTITAGGATAGATDKAGGNLLLQGGLSTGTGESGVSIYGCVAGATGTADRTQTVGVQVLGNKLAFFSGTPIIQQTFIAYTADNESGAYSGIDNLQVGSVYAQLTDLNALRVAYENLRAAYEDLKTKLVATTLLLTS